MVIRQFVFTLFAMFMVSQSHAGGESSGGSIVKFKRMTPEEAFKSRYFEKVIERKNLPQSSTSYNPAFELCIEQNLVRSVTPRETCKVWFVKSREMGERTQVFSTYKAALQYSDKKNGRGKPFCDPENEVNVVFAAYTDQVELDYKIDFYTKNPKSNSSEYLGTHSYMINHCTKEFMDLPWVEWSVAE